MYINQCILIKHYIKEIKKKDITQSLDASRKINQTLMHQSIRAS